MQFAQFPSSRCRDLRRAAARPNRRGMRQKVKRLVGHRDFKIPRRCVAQLMKRNGPAIFLLNARFQLCIYRTKIRLFSWRRPCRIFYETYLNGFSAALRRRSQGARQTWASSACSFHALPSIEIIRMDTVYRASGQRTLPCRPARRLDCSEPF